MDYHGLSDVIGNSFGLIKCNTRLSSVDMDYGRLFCNLIIVYTWYLLSYIATEKNLSKAY